MSFVKRVTGRTWADRVQIAGHSVGGVIGPHLVLDDRPDLLRPLLHQALQNGRSKPLSSLGTLIATASGR